MTKFSQIVFLNLFLCSFSLTCGNLLSEWDLCSNDNLILCHFECIGVWNGLKGEKIDGNTILIDIKPNELDLKGKIMCRSKSPTDFDFIGSKPQVDFIFNSNYNKEKGIFDSSLEFPLRSNSTGKFTFLLLDFDYKLQKEITSYIFIHQESNSEIFINSRGVLQSVKYIYEFILPCKISNPKFQNEVRLFGYKNLRNREEITDKKKISYDPKIGFTIYNYEYKHVNTYEYFEKFECMLQTDYVFIEKPKNVQNTGILLSFPVEYKKGNVKCSGKVQSIKFINSTSSVGTRLIMGCLKNNSKCPQDIMREVKCSKTQDCSTLPIYPSGILGCFPSNLNGDIISVQFIRGLDNKIYKFSDYLETNVIPASSLLNLKIMERYGTAELFELSYLYTKFPFTFECTAVTYIFSKFLEIEIFDKNFNKISNYNISEKVYEKSGIFGKKFSLELTTEMSKIVCKTLPFNSNIMKNATLDIVVREKSKPRFENDTKDFNFPKDEKTPYMLCQYYGVPRPEMRWKFEHENISHTINFDRQPTLSLTYLNFQNLSRAHEGLYTCFAKNSEGESHRNYTVKLENPTIIKSGIVALLVILGISIPTLLIAIFVAYYMRKPKIGLTKEEIEEFVRGNPEAIKNRKINESKGKYANENVDDNPYDKSYEIDPNDFKIEKENVLGSGAFGIIYKGQIGDDNCAIKTVKLNSEKSYLKSLLSELKIMIFLGKHEYLVNLLGAYTQELSEGIVYVFVELCSMGNLENFLRNNRYNFKAIDFDGSVSTGNYQNVQNVPIPNREMSTFDLANWSYQIASGMEYLSKKKVIHGDLAARNILILDKNLVKITDFGLSRKLYDYESYQKRQQEPLPWRWMSLESLRQLSFSTQSDVWSFGVTIWEIFSLGDVPYPGLSWTIDFVEKLANDMRMIKPHYCSDSIYQQMLNCWHVNPEKRQSFTQLKNYFWVICQDLNQGTAV